MNRYPPCAPRISRITRSILLALVVTASSQGDARAENETDTGGLTIHVTNIKHDDAPLRLQIVDEAAFGGTGSGIAQLVVPAKKGAVRISLDSLPAGEFAIRVMQDLDGDGKLGTNLVGMPNEPWGISNDAAGQFGPPSWSDARFVMPETRQQTITLR
ncbi:MAG: DUF2141 domain-containing protein [Pseudomonadota bacterium]